MNAKKHWGKILIVVALGVVFLVGAPGAQAAMVKNWTETIYTVSSEKLDFDWDQNSQYDLSFAEPSVKMIPLVIPTANVVGSLYQFLIPNFYDPLYKKTVDITMSGGNGGAQGLELARVLDVLGSDSLYGDEAPALPAPGEFVDGTISSTEVTEMWHIFPNPDYETVTIWAPAGFELGSVKIATQSVPLPPSVLLLGSTLLGLVFLRRRS